MWGPGRSRFLSGSQGGPAGLIHFRRLDPKETYFEKRLFFKPKKTSCKMNGDTDSQPQASRRVIIVNREGLHLRAASLLSQTAKQFQAQIEVSNRNRRIDAKSTSIELVTLDALAGDEVFIEAVGPDAQEAVEAIAKLIANQFKTPNEMCEPADLPALDGMEKRNKKGPPQQRSKRTPPRRFPSEPDQK